MSTQATSQKAQRFLRDRYRDEIGELAQNYPKEQLSIVIDWLELKKFDADLAWDYIENPRQISEQLDEALRQYDLPIDISLNRASVRVQNVPEPRTFDVGAYRSDHIGELIGVYGQVTKRTEVKPRPTEIAFECKRCGTMTRVPQSGEEIQEPHECQACERQGPFEENFEQSQFEDHQLVRIEQPPEQTAGGNGATVDAHLENDLVESITAGDRVTVSGVMSLESPSDGDITYEPYLDAESVEIEETDYEEIDTSEFEQSIREIASGERGDPFDLLMESIAPKIQGYEHIKLAIALQMFGGVRVEYPDGSADRGDSHILLLGDPGTAKSSLLRAATDIAPRSTYASGKGASAAGMTAAAVPDDFGNQRWSLEAGALVLADKGLAGVDEIDKIDEDAVSSLHGALEDQTVEVNKAGINATMPARTSLLAAGNPKHGRFDQYEPIADQIDLGPTLLSRFDLLFMIDDQPDEEQDRQVIEGMVSGRRTAAAYTKNPHGVDDDRLEEIEPAIDRETLRAYIAYAKQEVTPRIKDDAVEEYLTNTYAQLRLANGDDTDVPIPVTFRKLEGIMRLAEASARVRLSEEVTKDDVKRAQQLIGRSMRDVGFDEDEGQFDADIVETGTSKSQRGRIHDLKETIRDLYREGDGYPKIDEVADLMEEKGYERARVEMDIKKEKTKGELYEPQSGRITTTN